MHTTFWWGKTEGNIPFGKTRRRCEDSRSGMEAWTGLIRLRTGAGGGAVVKVVMNLRFHTVRVTSAS
jgi:hypothetical protein